MRDGPNSLAAIAMGAAMAATVLACAGCQVEYAPPSQIDKLRVLGVRAEPPQIRTDRPTRMKALVVGVGEETRLCYAWALCAFAMSRDGNYRCVDPDLQVPLGTAPTARTSLGDVLGLLAKLPGVMEKLGYPLPSSMDTSGGCDDKTGAQEAACLDERAARMARLQLYVLFKIATEAEFGGSCPTDPAAILDAVCRDRSRCVAGYKRLAIAISPKYHHANPRFDHLELGGVTWPEALTPTVLPYEGSGGAPGSIAGSGIDAELWTGYGPTALALKPVLDPASKERAPELRDLQGRVAVESLLMSWFSDGGRFKQNRSYDDFPDNLFLPPAPREGVPERTVSLWIVVRDGRNGTTWMRRRVRVRADADRSGNPLCRMDDTLSACKTATP